MTPEQTQMKADLKALIALQPCFEGLTFAKQFSSLAEAWEKCERPAWMLWYLRRSNRLSKPESVRLAIAFAERALPSYEARCPGKLAPRKAIEAAKAWLEDPSEANRKAADAYAAAYAAAYADAYAAAAAAAADAAADAAAHAAAYAYADAYAYAAAYAAAAAAERKQQCEVIRSLISNPFVK